jgi:hypothetical protein
MARVRLENRIPAPVQARDKLYYAGMTKKEEDMAVEA